MKRIVLLTLVIALAVFIGCSKEANTRPNYAFKPAKDGKTVAEFDGKSFSYDDLYGPIKGDIFQKEMEIHRMKMDKLESAVISHLIAKDKRKGKMSDDEFIEKYILKGKEATEKDIMAFVDERGFPKDQINPQMKNKIKAFLARDIKKKALESWLAKETKKNAISVYLKKPDRPYYDVEVTDADPAIGPKSAKVTIVEFSDFQCPFCAKAAKNITKIKKMYGDKIRVVFKHFPLPFHNHAKAASAASMCIYEQSPKKFWKAHDYFFENQDKLGDDELAKLGKKYSLDDKKYQECFSSKKYMGKVEADFAAGKKVYVKSTPTFFVNGRLISGAVPVEIFAEEIEKDL